MALVHEVSAACVRGDATESSKPPELAHALILCVDDLDERHALVVDLDRVGRSHEPFRCRRYRGRLTVVGLSVVGASASRARPVSPACCEPSALE